MGSPLKYVCVNACICSILYQSGYISGYYTTVVSGKGNKKISLRSREVLPFSRIHLMLDIWFLIFSHS